MKEACAAKLFRWWEFRTDTDGSFGRKLGCLSHARTHCLRILLEWNREGLPMAFGRRSLPSSMSSRRSFNDMLGRIIKSKSQRVRNGILSTASSLFTIQGSQLTCVRFDLPGGGTGVVAQRISEALQRRLGAKYYVLLHRPPETPHLHIQFKAGTRMSKSG